jgi:uncharacterized RDD family membrane protein YckC
MFDEAIRVPAGLTTDGLLRRRYFARGIDVMIIALLIGMMLEIGRTLVPSMANSRLTIFLTPVLFLIAWIGYGSALESSKWQATIGKRLMRLRVYNADGGRPTLRQAAKRNLVKDGPFFVIGWFPGASYLLLAWLGAHLVVLHRSPASQAIHDFVAHTWVAASEQTIQLHLT